MVVAVAVARAMPRESPAQSPHDHTTIDSRSERGGREGQQHVAQVRRDIPVFCSPVLAESLTCSLSSMLRAGLCWGRVGAKTRKDIGRVGVAQ